MKAEYYQNYSIPDPNDKLTLVSLLRSSEICREAGLSAEQTQAIQEAMEKNGGSFSISVLSSNSDKPGSAIEARADFYRKRENSAKLLDEIIRPEQWIRLKEIAYQVEAYRVGLGTAITNGKLAADAGVTENQKTHLREKAAELEGIARIEIAKILEKMQSDLLSELPAEQRETAKKLLGKSFYFQEGNPRKK